MYVGRKSSNSDETKSSSSTSSGPSTNITNLPPTPCKLSNEPRWGECSASCDGGVQQGVFDILEQPTNGGTPCPPENQRYITRTCNTQECTVDCQVTPWSDWTDCDQTCGGGTQSRLRYVSVAPRGGGAQCPSLTEVQACNTQPCPVDCQVSGWSNWSLCDRPCGGGTQTRSRTVTVQPQNGGASCPALTEVQACNNQACATPQFAIAGPFQNVLVGGELGFDFLSQADAINKCLADPNCQGVAKNGDKFSYTNAKMQYNVSPIFNVSSWIKVPFNDPVCATTNCVY